ncbi:hypothetical protein Cni_G18874 [Canna indica]|uniref:Uncharacterized protein n=1 Tax=Canna indica TaxID=4628 RepID=A0AAQ3KKB4_9LILI|nr:hypothetical protein Cni_G18874 [Canna indica]
MDASNASSEPEEPMQQIDVSVSEVQVQILSRRLEALERSMRYLEDNMMIRLSAMEERVEVSSVSVVSLITERNQLIKIECLQELMSRVDGYNDLSRSWSEQLPLNVPTVAPNALVTPLSPPVPPRHKKQGTLTARRVIRRYQRLVKPSWDNKTFVRRIIKRIEEKRRHRS